MVNNSNPCEIILISFSVKAVLQDKYYSLENERYMIQTRLQMRTSGVQLPEVHGSRKGLDHHKILEKQLQPIMGLDIEKKPSQYTEPGSSESKPIIINSETVSVGESIPEIPEVKYFHLIFYHKTDLLQNPLIN